MTRRIALVLLALVVTLLAAVVAPLGLQAAAQYRSDFVDATQQHAEEVARVVEEHISDHEHGKPLATDLRSLRPRDGELLVLGQDGRPLLPSSLRLSSALSRRAVAATAPRALPGEIPGRLLVVAPVADGDTRSATVVEARLLASVSDRIDTLWTHLIIVALLAIVASVAAAWWLARWVGRPLKRLESVTNVVGGGDLSARTGQVLGPVEMRRLAKAFDSMTARLEQLVIDHRNVVADVSHQLRTPIATLRLRLELLLDRTPQAEEEVRGALQEVARLSRMLDGMLAVARAEAHTAVPTTLDLCAVVTERVHAWAPLAAERGIALSARTNPQVSTIMVEDHVEQALDNLLANCLEVQPPPSTVVVSVDRARDFAVVAVIDNGPGMTQQQRASATRRFNTGRGDDGTGLGLAIVDRLITSGGGDLHLTATPGGGLTVSIELPLAETSPRRPLRRLQSH